MTDRWPPLDGDTEPDVELERRLRAAFGAAVPGAPTPVHAEVARLAAVPDIRTRTSFGGRLSPGWVAAALALSALALGSMFSAGPDPAPTGSSVPASADATVEASRSSGVTCAVSTATVHGTWWSEIGGPNAFFNRDDGSLPAQAAPWKLIVRFDPDSTSTSVLSVWADHLGSGERVVGGFNGRLESSMIFHFDTPAPGLPGGWYLFGQPLPTAGCWRLSAAIDGWVVGTAVVEVVEPDAPGATASPSIAPTPVVEPTPPVAATMKPSADDVLPLAGRDGQPGMLYCGPFMPFDFGALDRPTGAEDAVGPEFDVLRSTAATDPDPGGDFGPDPAFREVARDANAVLFLHELPAGTRDVGRSYLYIYAESDGVGWRWAGSGDCSPRAVPPPGYGQAIWTLDPRFRAPGDETQTLHLLVQELACAGGKSASGRISPAFVTWDERQLMIEVLVETLAGEGECVATPPTPATLRLPIPVGDRTLSDPVTREQGGTGG